MPHLLISRNVIPNPGNPPICDHWYRVKKNKSIFPNLTFHWVNKRWSPSPQLKIYLQYREKSDVIMVVAISYLNTHTLTNTHIRIHTNIQTGKNISTIYQTWKIWN